MTCVHVYSETTRLRYDDNIVLIKNLQDNLLM